MIMWTMWKPLLLLALFAGAILVTGLILKLVLIKATESARNAPRYRKIPQLLTKTEQQFWEVLKRAIPDGVHIHSKVRLCDLVECRFGNNQKDFNRISSKHVDFVLCAEDSTVLGVIELDDSTHYRADRKRRDQFVDDVMGDAGIRILHVHTKQGYDIQSLTADINAMIAST